jgi:hypothetical protein
VGPGVDHQEVDVVERFGVAQAQGGERDVHALGIVGGHQGHGHRTDLAGGDADVAPADAGSIGRDPGSTSSD